jgi:hypothetical protein
MKTSQDCIYYSCLKTVERLAESFYAIRLPLSGIAESFPASFLEKIADDSNQSRGAEHRA